jgi:hypothetical protein
MVAVALLAVVVVVAQTGRGAPTITPGEARIRLTADLIEMRTAHGFSYRTFALYNRPAYPDRLGTGVVSCVTVAKGWLDCSELLRLTRGTIITRGLVPAAAAYRVLSVVGGTGAYSNTGGEMTVQPLGGRGAQQILVNLIAY